MWIFTTFGFFSVVQKPGDDGLTVRARVREDLDALRTQYLPTLSPTIEGEGTDYRYRATVSHEALAEAMSRLVRDVSYGNFKDAVAKRSGAARAEVYHEVWSALYPLQRGSRR